MSDPNSYPNPDHNQSQNPDNMSYTNLMLFGTPNTPGSSGSTQNLRPNMPPYGMCPPYGMYQQQFDYNQQQYGSFPNPYFQQQPNFSPQQQQFQQPPQQPPQQPEEVVSQRSGKQVTPSPKKRSHRKKSDGDKKTCNKRQWAPKEDAWLATCWCDTSEDSAVGNSQRRGTLWGTVEEKFMSNTHGWVRGADQLSSKWRVINNTCKAFNGIYESQARAWGSGRDEGMVYDQAVAEYYDTYTKTFTMKEAWLAVKDHPKWKAPPPVGGTGLRDEEDDFSVDLSADAHPSASNELFGPDPLQRPMGRNRARKAARSSGSSDAATSSRTSTPNEKVDEAIENMAKYKAELLAARKASIEAITRQERLRTAMQGVQFLQINTADISDPSDRAAVARMKKTFRNEFREFYEAEDEDEDDDE